MDIYYPRLTDCVGVFAVIQWSRKGEGQEWGGGGGGEIALFQRVGYRGICI